MILISDSEQKPKAPSVDDGFVEDEVPIIQRSNSPVVEVRQLSAIADVNQDILCSQVAIMSGKLKKLFLYCVYRKIPCEQKHD